MAWADGRLFVASDRLYIYNSDLEITGSWALPLAYVAGLAWDGSALAFLGSGPGGIGGGATRIVRFRIDDET